MIGMYFDLLKARVRAMHTLYARAVADMTLAQVNHAERGGVLPIAFSLLHVVRIEDRTVCASFLPDHPADLWKRGGWAEKVGTSGTAYGRGTPMAAAEATRFTDWEAWKAYQAAVFAQTDTALAALPEASLTDVVVPSLPPDADKGFPALIVGARGTLRKVEIIEFYLYQNGIRHIGEIEHARALVGLGGVTG